MGSFWWAGLPGSCLALSGRAADWLPSGVRLPPSTLSPACSKTLIGDYLGERDEFNLRVMHCYVDALEFTEMDFDAAIRCVGSSGGRAWGVGSVDRGWWC